LEVPLNPITETLLLWIQGLVSIRAGCAKVNTSTNDLTLNAFGKASVSSLLPSAGNITSFIKYTNQQFAKSGPQGWNLQPPINTTSTFADIITFIWHNLFYSTMRFVQAYCPASCTNAAGNLVLTTPLTVAFPLGPQDQHWMQLIIAIKTVNLDEIIAPNALIKAAGQLTPPPPETLSDLIATLSTL
jgi:hypothetical protein